MTTDSPTRAKFLPVPDKPEERRDVREQRCDVDLIPIEDTRMAARFTPTTRTTDAFRPLLEAVQRLGASIDRVTEQVEANHRAEAEAKSDKRLAALREYLRRPLRADMLQTDGCRRPWRLRSTFRDESYSQ
jgi:hypothetical protein